jgi:Bacteriophage head to tail connecting protein
MNLEEHLLEQGTELFGKRSSLLSFWQEVAENFYPERADFTMVRNIGQDFASNLMTSYPILARRDLGNAISAILRPSGKKWLHVRTTENWDKLGVEARAWLEWAEGRMIRAMNHRTSQWVRATKEGDMDFASFGQTVIQTTMNPTATGLLYRCWHLRDVAWQENAGGIADTVYRRWKPTARQLVNLFGKDRVHPSTYEYLDKKPLTEVEVWHVVIPTTDCPYGKTVNTPFKSVYFEVNHKHIIEEVGIYEQEYTIPRWQTVSGSQYAYSPSTVAALPDARLIQAMTAVLLEAGEKAVTPPMIATQEAIRSDINVYAGGITFVDQDYDERLGEVLRPLTQDKNGIPVGFNLQADTRAMIAEAFYLNKLTLPAQGQDMTAYEVGQRIQEYIRQAMPLFEPMESEYNAPLCDITFSKLMRAGAFGSPLDMPKELRNQSIEFTFESPLHDASEREKGQRYIEASQMLAAAQGVDQSSVHTIDAVKALRETLLAIGTPASWIRSEADVADRMAKDQEQMQMAQSLAAMEQGANVAKTFSEATAATTTEQGAI